MDQVLDRFHKRCEDLTGDVWCPYPNDVFMTVVLGVDDETAKRLIVGRRKFLMPTFLQREPQEEELRAAIKATPALLEVFDLGEN